MAELTEELRQALGSALQEFRPQDLAQSVAQLIARYRSGQDPAKPILASDLDVAAYAAYRMPATYGAVQTAMRAFAQVMPDFAPQNLIDLGGGTGAAAWAASLLWPSLRDIAVVEQQKQAIAFGRQLASKASSSALQSAEWQEADATDLAAAPADLVTISYLLGELPEVARDRIVRRWAGAARALIIVEPGTPAGYKRILRARELLLDCGFSIAAPCPHHEVCPIKPGQDWCHFAARVSRTSLHRQVKDATLGFEDEKFSYLAAIREPASRVANRVLRHPQKRKGLVGLRLCTANGQLADVMVSQRNRESYRDARDVSWGDRWPASGEVRS